VEPDPGGLSAGERVFLTVYEGAQGQVWTYVVADSPEAIVGRYARVRIVDDPPPWLPDAFLAGLRERPERLDTSPNLLASTLGFAPGAVFDAGTQPAIAMPQSPAAAVWYPVAPSPAPTAYPYGFSGPSAPWPGQWPYLPQPWIPPATPGPAPGFLWAGMLQRLLALTIDAVVVVALYALVYAIDLALANSSPEGWDYPPALAFALIGLTGLFLIVPVSWILFGGTLGQRAVGLQVLRAVDGGRLGAGRAMVRYLVLLAMIIIPVVGLLSAILALSDPRRRTWADTAADSVVVRRAS
jgi:uncharacterized RDD family membrane protein YckC